MSGPRPIFHLRASNNKASAHSASEARDLRLARVCSGFRTAILSADAEIGAEELERLAEVELRFR